MDLNDLWFYANDNCTYDDDFMLSPIQPMECIDELTEILNQQLDTIDLFEHDHGERECTSVELRIVDKKGKDLPGARLVLTFKYVD